MALWGNKDSKTASGTIAIATNGAVTGSSTAFTTEAKIGNTIRADGRDYVITKITSDTAATVESGVNGGSLTAVTSGTSYTLSEKPVYVAQAESAGSAAGVHGNSNNVFGVDVTEIVSGGDNIQSVAIVQGGTLYVEAPAVTFSGGGGSSAAATATISGGAVTAITVTNTGTGYTSVPTVNVAVPCVTIATSAVNTTTEVISYTGHGLATGDEVIYYNGGSTSITGLTSGTTYSVIRVDDDSFKVAVDADAAEAGTAINLTGTGNNAQYFDKVAGTTATATAARGDGAVGGAAHAGWVRRTVGTGGRAGRVFYETLVASGTTAATSGDQADDIQFRDS